MAEGITIGPARRDEWLAALDLLLRHVEADPRSNRVAMVVNLLETGDIPADGLLVVRDDASVVASILCIPLKGASGLVWPPAGVADARSRLVELALRSLREKGAKLAQALLTPDELPLAAPLLAGGFRHATQLLYLRHDLQDVVAPASELIIEPWSAANEQVFV